MPQWLPRNSNFAKVGTALLYAASSTLITIVNKSVLTGYGFPSYRFLAACQMLVTATVLYVAKQLGRVTFPDVDGRTFVDVFPMPLIHLGNAVLGLAGTKELSLPMFTVLRRLAIPMTMLGEYYFLGAVADPLVKLSVAMMVAGAAIIAVNDEMELNINRYTFVLFNDLLTAANGVFTKKKLNANRQIGKCGLMYYSSLFMIPPLVVYLYFSDDLNDVYRYVYTVYLYLLIYLFIYEYLDEIRTSSDLPN